LAGDDANEDFVGLLMVGLPPDWWLPPGYTLSPTGQPTVPLSATDPFGRPVNLYPIPDYAPSDARSDSIAAVIERELGAPALGFSPGARQALGMNRPDLLGAANRTIMAPVEGLVALFDLANYGISAGIVAGTEGLYRAGWMDRTSSQRLRRDLMLLSQVVAIETGRSPAALTGATQGARLRAATAARVAATARPGAAIRITQQMPHLVMEELRVSGHVPRLARGRQFDQLQAAQYDFNQVYVVRPSGNGYVILDSYSPVNPTLAAGPVSRKFTQLAEIELNSAVRYLQEAATKYRPGLRFADVRSLMSGARPHSSLTRGSRGNSYWRFPCSRRRCPEFFWKEQDHST
jgi:hypothetical protein